jgi:hypothetical protein
MPCGIGRWLVWNSRLSLSFASFQTASSEEEEMGTFVATHLSRPFKYFVDAVVFLVALSTS